MKNMNPSAGVSIFIINDVTATGGVQVLLRSHKRA